MKNVACNELSPARTTIRFFRLIRPGSVILGNLMAPPRMAQLKQSPRADRAPLYSLLSAEIMKKFRVVQGFRTKLHRLFIAALPAQISASACADLAPLFALLSFALLPPQNRRDHFRPAMAGVREPVSRCRCLSMVAVCGNLAPILADHICNFGFETVGAPCQAP